MRDNGGKVRKGVSAFNRFDFIEKLRRMYYEYILSQRVVQERLAEFEEEIEKKADRRTDENIKSLECELADARSQIQASLERESEYELQVNSLRDEIGILRDEKNRVEAAYRTEQGIKSDVLQRLRAYVENDVGRYAKFRDACAAWVGNVITGSSSKLTREEAQRLGLPEFFDNLQEEIVDKEARLNLMRLSFLVDILPRLLRKKKDLRRIPFGCFVNGLMQFRSGEFDKVVGEDGSGMTLEHFAELFPIDGEASGKIYGEDKLVDGKPYRESANLEKDGKSYSLKFYAVGFGESKGVVVSVFRQYAGDARTAYGRLTGRLYGEITTAMKKQREVENLALQFS